MDLQDKLDSVNQLGQTRANTVFTVGQPFGQGHILFTAEKWFRVKLRLETAGPVTVGFTSAINAVGAGAGASLGDDEVEIVVKKGDTLYYVANAVNRVRVILEPIPWAEQIYMRFTTLLKGMSSAAAPTPSAPRPQPKTRGRKPVFGNIQGRRW